ncbi:hypothetical protein PV328_012178 [Microctonus aethiopoides]|uniref:Uncharacterized protein n=1 Tax=Microctonus aethiopoides TaxID=144406 RepID=A0AA39C2Q9_9HYME|nr:hypothetical protein PV328_012178 [Microctonus aethiopoides]
MGTRAAVYGGQRTRVGFGKVRKDVRILRSHGVTDEILVLRRTVALRRAVRCKRRNGFVEVLKRTVNCCSLVTGTGHWYWTGVARTEQPVKTGRRLSSDGSCSALYSRGAALPLRGVSCAVADGASPTA